MTTSSLPADRFSGFGYSSQVDNTSLSHVYQAPLLDQYDHNRGGVLNQFANSPVKFELPSSQFSPHQSNNNNVIQQQDSKFNMPIMNHNAAMKSNAGSGGANNNAFLGDSIFQDHQALTPGNQTTMTKRSYFYTDEGNVLDGGQRGFDELPLNSSNWPTNAGYY